MLAIESHVVGRVEADPECSINLTVNMQVIDNGHNIHCGLKTLRYSVFCVCMQACSIMAFAPQVGKITEQGRSVYENTGMRMREAENVALPLKQRIHERGICVKKMCNILSPDHKLRRVLLCECVSCFAADGLNAIKISENSAYDLCKPVKSLDSFTTR